MGLTEVLGFVLGQIIGAGVLVLTGVGIGLTGKGVIWAFVASGVMNCLYCTVVSQLSAALPATGAGYRYSGLLLSPRFGFLWQLGIICSKVTIALYALGFAQYLQGLLPSLPVKSAALAMITFFFLINLVGLKPAAVLQKWLVVIKISALLVFVAWGISSVHFASFVSTAEVLPNGWDAMLQTIGILSFASAGANVAVELGGEMKNPRRDIPIAVYVGTIGSTLIYVLVGLVAAGVLPVNEVANKPLSIVARTVLPEPAYLYFMIGGAVIALCTTLNSIFQWMTKGLLVSCQDGWLPRRLGEVSKRFGTPHYCLLFFYLVGVITIVSGITLDNIARIGFAFLLCVNILPVIGCAFLPKKYPEQYEKAVFRLKPATLQVVVWLTVIVLAGQAFYTIKGLPTNLLMATLAVLALAIIYVAVVGSRIDKSRLTQFDAEMPPGRLAGSD
jgi:APA family basic amino acid/polyamine antiporter